MSFRKKLDMILKASELLPGRRLTINKIEQAIGSDGTLYKNHKADTYPTKSELIPEMIRKFKISQEWWDTGKGDIFVNTVDGVSDNKIETVPDEISLLIKNLDRMGNWNEYLLKRVQELEKKLDQCLNK